jgi:hypothetical protein
VIGKSKNFSRQKKAGFLLGNMEKKLSNTTIKDQFYFDEEALNGGAIPIFTIEDLVKSLKQREEAFPLLNNGRSSFIEGEIGKTGVVIRTQEGPWYPVVASLPHPQNLPKSLEGRRVDFGGMQTDARLETALEKPLSPKRTRNDANLILEALKQTDDFSEVSQNFTGLGAIGSEPEAWVIDPQIGNLAPISGGELQYGLLEKTLPPVSDPLRFLQTRAKFNLERAEENQNFLVVDTSVLPTSNPWEVKVNNGGNKGHYIQAVQHFLYEHYFNFSDPIANLLMDKISQQFGFSSYKELHELKNDMAYWVMAASHASIGLHHRREGIKAMWTSAQEAIAIADIFNSDLATVAEFLMFSTPIIYGLTPQVKIADEEYWPRDYRVILRYLMDTTFPAPFIGDPEKMYDNMSRAIINGYTHTLDRASYLTEVNGRVIAVQHGRVRNRIASTEPLNQTGRIEFTGCSASPSILDELARNCFLQILAVGAYEALANGQHPIEYFGERYPHLASWEEQKNLVTKANLFGFNHPEVSNLINEALNFIEELVGKYPALRQQVEVTRWRIENLKKSPVSSLQIYLENPNGPISEVIQNEIKKGIDSLELVKRIAWYQNELSRRILDGNFDFFFFTR